MSSAHNSSVPKRCSLASIQRPKSIWVGDRLSDWYRNITRFVLQELYGRDNDRGPLDPECIFLTRGEAKVESLPNWPKTFREEFIGLIVPMLRPRNIPEKSELTHFIKMVEDRTITFEKLFHHPLLQSTTERIRFPIRALHLNVKGRRTWEQDYKKFNKTKVNFNLQIQKSIYKDAFNALLYHRPRRSPRNAANHINHNRWRTCKQKSFDLRIQKSIYKDPFKSLHNHGRLRPGYKNTVVGVLRFSRNAAIHINQHSKTRMTEEEIENELTKMFPTRLIDLYEFLVSTNTSMDFLLD